ncbi:MAG: hypothetical protein PUC73_05450 [Lachnospiraceae bacterium]|nr:hypothetical protein [Lachnospiraceae bacterium]
MAKKKKKMEFSKMAFICTTVLFGSVIAGSFALMWYTQTTDALSYLITATAGLTTTATGFYYHKAKMENLLKIRKDYNLSFKELQNLTNSTEETCEDTTYGEDM